MDLRLHNSLTRQLEVFVPGNPERVTLYVCGPTVYNYAHIGNARPPVVFGLLADLLRRRYPKVIYARNITDIDDRINQSASEQGVPISVISNRFADAYFADMDALGAAQPDVQPRATEHIAQIIRMCQRLIANGHAYAAEGHVLFDVASFADYGKLSGRSTDEMVAGARIEVAPYKRNPGDFVLWKPSSADLPGWDSPWGSGRPGWHIECSAMAETHLGDTIDIHAGGVDLLFPHHENEVAQSTCAHDGEQFARHWLHNGFVTVEGRKMSKSLGNVLLVDQLRREHSAEALRFLLLNAHYRQPMDWSDAALVQARATLDRLYGALRENPPVDEVERVPEELEAALCEDINTPQALALLSQYARELKKAEGEQARQLASSRLRSAGKLLGLLQQDPAQWFQGDSRIDEAQIMDLLNQRQAAKQARDFARADAIRQQLTDSGIQIEDTPEGPRWRVDHKAGNG
ncbi:MAG: cysteine--tRNA ligase [Xanthomonadales bacterium]|nr:cysteine--tRNA ligase [Xanthomonadales bacterium]